MSQGHPKQKKNRMYSGRDIGEVMIFFRKHEPALRAPQVNISKKITKFVECNFPVYI